MRIIRADGSVHDSEFKEVSAEMVIDTREVPQLTIEARMAKINNLAEEMARQMATNLFGSLNEDLDKTGQVVDRHGNSLVPLSRDTSSGIAIKSGLSISGIGSQKSLQEISGVSFLSNGSEHKTGQDTVCF